tara:strand:+ start:643 stop:936 length:294 start_codon:yes stop_codon:yes gene_type:complete
MKDEMTLTWSSAKTSETALDLGLDFVFVTIGDMELNVLQVSFDHMIEHLEALTIKPASESGLFTFEERMNNAKRLQAAKKLKSFFSEIEILEDRLAS